MAKLSSYTILIRKPYSLYMPSITTGSVLTSKNGRQMSPVPKIDCSTERKYINTLKRVNAWLIEEAKQECKFTNNEFQSLFLTRMKPDKLSAADIDTLNHILF